MIPLTIASAMEDSARTIGPNNSGSSTYHSAHASGPSQRRFCFPTLPNYFIPIAIGRNRGFHGRMGATNMAEQIPSNKLCQTRILVVDDHPGTADMLARAIAQLGPDVSVLSATSGRSALEKAGDGAVDVLITDMVMPDLNGLELIEKLQAHPGGRRDSLFLSRPTRSRVEGDRTAAEGERGRDQAFSPGTYLSDRWQGDR